MSTTPKQTEAHIRKRRQWRSWGAAASLVISRGITSNASIEDVGRELQAMLMDNGYRISKCSKRKPTTRPHSSLYRSVVEVEKINAKTT